MDFITTLAAHHEVIERLAPLAPQLDALVDRLQACLAGGGKVLWLGNGGSAADCQHLAAELVVRYKANRRALASLALTTDTSVLTAHSNDFGFETVFARQLEALARPGDVVMALSTSGTSPNVLAAAETARRLGVYCVGWTGAGGGRLAGIADETLRAPSDVTARIQEAHMLIGHWLCEALEARFAA